MPISAPLEMEAGTLAEQIFSQLSTDEFGKLPVDELVWQAKCWFCLLYTSPSPRDS